MEDFEGNGLLKIRLPIRGVPLQFGLAFACKFRFTLLPGFGFHTPRGRAMSTDTDTDMGTGMSMGPAMRISF